MSKKWYAVYTKPKWEKKVVERLTQSNLECYCPLNKVLRQWHDRKKIIHEPLFTSYVFVRVAENEQGKLNQIDGIITLVRYLGKPAVIRDEEIESIRNFLKEHNHVKLVKTTVDKDDVVQIVKGPLTNQTGSVTAVRNNYVKVMLPSLGYFMVAEININDVTVLPPKVTTPQNVDTKY